MRETIILTDLNERELLRTFAKRGRNTFSVRVFNTVNLAKEALVRSGIPVKETVSDIRESCIFANLFKEIPYFENASFLDAVHFVKSYSDARMLCRENEEEKLNNVFSDGEFKKKNEAIQKAIQSYRKYLAEHDLKDSFDIVHEAIDNAGTIDADFIVFTEEECAPLSETLLKHLSNGNYKKTSILEYTGKVPQPLHGISYDDGYGEVNEIEHIFKEVIDNDISFDDVIIATQDSGYINTLESYCQNYDIPMTFGTGRSFTGTNAVRILTLLYRWSEGYYALDPLKNLLNADEFDAKGFWKDVGGESLDKYTRDRIIESIGHLRLSEKADSLKLDEFEAVADYKEKANLPYIRKIADILAKGFDHIVETYTKTYGLPKEKNAVLKVTNILREYKEYINDYNTEDVLKLIANQSVGKELSTPGKIHVTDLKGALSVNRKHLFVAGLNAKTFPGSPSEDYLLLDSDLERFNESTAKDSHKKISDNKKLLLDVLNIASGMSTKIHLSYSGYNLSELKNENPSSMLFEIYQKEKGEKVSIDDFNEEIGKQHPYFESGLSRQSEMGRSYLNGNDIVEIPQEQDEYASCQLSRALSPSSTENYFACPKQFYLSNILNIDQIDEDDVFNQIPANEFGTLFHSCMEDFNHNPSMTLEEFKENAMAKINAFFHKRIPVHDKGIGKIKDEFMEVTSSGYEMDKKAGRKPVDSEYKFKEVEFENTGLKFNGKVDLVEDNGDGTFTIVDYKTGRNIKHQSNDIYSCLQAVIYAYLYEKEKNCSVTNNEYRYPRQESTVECIYNDAVKENLEGLMDQIVDNLKAGEFIPDPDKDNCKYCKYSFICGKENQKGETDDSKSNND